LGAQPGVLSQNSQTDTNFPTSDTDEPILRSFLRPNSRSENRNRTENKPKSSTHIRTSDTRNLDFETASTGEFMENSTSPSSQSSNKENNATGIQHLESSCEGGNNFLGCSTRHSTKSRLYCGPNTEKDNSMLLVRQFSDIEDYCNQSLMEHPVSLTDTEFWANGLGPDSESDFKELMSGSPLHNEFSVLAKKKKGQRIFTIPSFFS